MTKEQYKEARKARGTQRSVAAKLGVHHMTICKRETGAQVITKEAELALLSLKTL